jgi:hypothetical protein
MDIALLPRSRSQRCSQLRQSRGTVSALRVL